MGMLAEIRASLARSDSGGEIVLVRFYRLCAGWEPAGRREDLAEALPRYGRWERKSHRIRFRIQNESCRCRVFEWSHDARDGLQRHLLESRSVPPERSYLGSAGAL